MPYPDSRMPLGTVLSSDHAASNLNHMSTRLHTLSRRVCQHLRWKHAKDPECCCCQGGWQTHQHNSGLLQQVLEPQPVLTSDVPSETQQRESWHST